MVALPRRSDTAACRCGQVALRIEGVPIMRTACYCNSCQKAGHLLGRLPNALAVVGSDGGTDYLLFRKDRVRCTRGGEHLKELRLKPWSSTRRMIAACCNTAMFLDVSKGHWVTFYRGRIAGSVPPLQARVMTAERRGDVVLPSGVPSYPGRAGKLIWKLMAAWAAMGFRIPNIEGVPRQARENQAGVLNI